MRSIKLVILALDILTNSDARRWYEKEWSEVNANRHVDVTAEDVNFFSSPIFFSL